ncbi:MAG: MerR family transcriptional regulator [bacterium]|nr:MerR family transcriptional regulator [bacterium]MCM1376088.1 MerR family transcriptional regulator [Muribaculum sp.]
MKIKQVEELVDITRKNIRFYEEQGLLSVGRSENGYREYGTEDVRRLKQIRLLRRLSVPIEDIKRLFDGRRTLEDVLERQQARLERQRESLHRTQLFCKLLLEDSVCLETLDVDGLLEQMDKLEREGVMFMDETHRDIHRKKQRGAILGAGVMLILTLAPLGIIFGVTRLARIPLWALLLFLGVTTVVCIGIVVALMIRIKEIRGGEEDEASKY